MARETEWHPWFAWFPVLLDDGRFAWLRWVECRKWFLGPRTEKRGTPDLMFWHFREPESR